MADIAALGLRIDSSDAVTATSTLGFFADSARKAEDSTKKLASAQTAGATAAQRHAAAQQRARAAAAALLVEQQQAARAARRVGFQFQNASYQVGDFFVQITSGTDAMRAASMQLPQLLGAFGMWGAILGAVAAAGGALVPVLRGIKKEVADIDDFSFSGVETSIEKLMSLEQRHIELIEARAITQDQTTNITIAALNREAIAQRAIVEIETIRAGRQLQSIREQVQKAREEYNSFREERMRTMQNEIGFIPSPRSARDGAPFAPDPSRQAFLQDAMERARTGADQLRAIIAETSEEEQRLNEELRLQEATLVLLESQYRSISDAISDINSQGESTRANAEESAVWAANMLETLHDEASMREVLVQYGEDSIQATEARVQAERDAFVELLNSKEMSDELRGMLIQAWDAANGVASVDMAGNISLAADAAERLVRLLNMANMADSKQYSGRGGDPRRYMEGGSESDYESSFDYTPVEEVIAEERRRIELRTKRLSGGGGRKPRARKGAGGAGGRGGKSDEEREAERKANELKREGISLTERLRTAEEEYADELERIKELHDSNNISTETYNRALKDLNERYAEMELGPLKDELKSFGQSLLDVARDSESLGEAFARMIDNIVEKIYNSHIDSLVDNLFSSIGEGGPSGGSGIMGFLGQLFSGGGGVKKSFAGGGYTGNGPRTGGLDGKGGFLRIVHPRETITDHTVPQPSQSPRSTTVNVINQTGIQARAEVREDGDGRMDIILRKMVQDEISSSATMKKIRRGLSGAM